jgi:hypothetical protein
VATNWGPLVQTSIGAAAAIGGGAVAAWVQGRQQRRMERDRRRERAAEILAEVQALLTDANPDRLGINANEATFERTFTAFHERWQKIRIPLLTLAANHQSKRVRDLARRLEVATANALTQAQWLVRDVLSRRDLSDTRDTANQDHAAASKLLDELLEAIRRRK